MTRPIARSSDFPHRPFSAALLAMAGGLAAPAAAQGWRIVAANPEPRASHAIAWDAIGGRLLSFGGQPGRFIASATTAHRVGTRWNVLPVAAPPARMMHAMAADPLRGSIVVVGGHAPIVGPVLGMEEWDGTRWQTINPGGGPQPGSALVACSHVRSGGVMFFGGGGRDETWSWNGQQWTLHQPVVRPSRRDAPGVAYDLNRDVVVLFGGSDSVVPVGGTFEWDGTNWTDVRPAMEPPPDRAPMMAFDPLRNRTVLFTSTGNTWEYDGATWLQHNPVHRPARRTSAAMAFDPWRNRILLDGGDVSSLAATNYLADSWEWDGVDWVEVDSGVAVPNRVTDGLVDDPATGDVLALDTNYRYRLHGGAWTSEPLAGPQPLESATELAGDPARGSILAFPGSSTTPGARTWTFAAGQWTPHFPAQQPANRVAHAMAYDGARGRVVLFGGADASGAILLQDTWEWDGIAWTQVNGPLPPPRSDHAMAEDPAGGVLMFGGFGGTYPTDTWRFTAAGWQQVSNTGPAGRILHGMATDIARARVVLVGGLVPPGRAPSDHWEWDGSQWTLIGSVPEGTNWRLASSRRGAVLVLDRLTMEYGGPSAAAAEYGSGCGVGAIVPRLAAGGLPELGRQRFEIVLDRSPGPSLAMIVGSTVPANVAIGACTQLVASPVTLLGGITAPSAHVQWEIPVPDRASLRGQRIYMQGAVLHTGGPLLGLASLSNGLDLLLDF